MTDDVIIIWRCPTCGKRVSDRRPFVSALETEEDAASSTDAGSVFRPVRFHEGHFQPRIRGRIYLMADSHEASSAGPVLEAIREAYEALGDGEVEPLVALMDREVDWRGRRSRLTFWRPVPS